MTRRGATTVLLLLALLAPPAAAQDILLQIRPRQGDTLRVRMDQQVEMSGTARVGGADTTLTMTSGMHVATRAIILRSDPRTTTVLSVTDSVSLTSNTATVEMLDRTRRSLQGKRIHFRIALDGASELVDDGPDADGMRDLFAQMPATLPTGPVKVGETWTREMMLPSASQPGARHAGSIKAVFRLDSLSRKGEVAWISMRGEISRDSAPELPAGAKFAMHGTLTGIMAVDRRRGWLASSRTVLSVRSLLEPPAGSTGGPMRFRMTVTQTMRTEK